MKAKQCFCKTCALAVVILLMLSLCTACSSDNSSTELSKLIKEAINYTALREEGELKPLEESTVGLKLAQENAYLCLYYNESNAEVSVFDKRTGGWWHSNPDNATTPASKSQLNISTITSNGVVKQYTSFTDSISKGQVTFKTEHGLTVMYTFGNPKTDLEYVPQRLSDKRHDELVKRIEDAGGNASLLTRRYNHKDGIWTLKTTITNDQAKKLREVFELIGYTKEELAKDNAGSNSATENESFIIPLNYILQDDSLKVYIDYDSTVYPKNEIITSLDVLEYFGAMEQDEDGYLFVPDGSGALVDTKKYGGVAYANLKLYGKDHTIPQQEISTVGNDCLLPVFGINRGDGAILAIVEDSEAVASIDVVKPGHIDEYATVSTAFALNATQNIGLSSDSISKFYITADTRYKGDVALRYIFLQKEDSGYVGMADIYRDYLDLIGKRTLIEKQDNIPFILETIGAIKAEVSTMGFIHDTLVPLTTYSDNIMLIGELENRGVNNISLLLNGWMNGGADSGLPDRVGLISELGGKSDFNNLVKWAKENDVVIYPQILLNTFSASEGLTKKNKYSSYSLDSKKSYISRYEPITYSPITDDSRYLISPIWQCEFSKKITNDLLDLNVIGINIGDLASTSYSDYNADSEVLRQASRLQSQSILKQFSKIFSNLMLTAPNDITANYGRLYTDVPKSSSSLTMASCSVPFYQMIYHGYAQYSFTAMNYDVDLVKSMLKFAEYGACPNFSFTVREDKRANFLDSAEYYASYYENWLDSAGEVYGFLNELLSPVANSRMVGHDQLSEGVYRTDYDNGMSVYVNYNKVSVTVDGVTIEPESAVRRERA